mgnify:FL=1
MELLLLNTILLYLGTVGLSLISVAKVDLKLLKNFADEGYKINFDKHNEIYHTSDIKKKVLSNFFIPIWNLIYAFKTVENYQFSSQRLSDTLSLIDALEEMNAFEKMEYMKNPTVLNALLVPIKFEQRVNNAIKITIEDQNGTSDIYYDITPGTEKINILKVTGPLKDYSEEELQEIIIESRQAVTSFISEVTEEVLKETLHVNPDEEINVQEKLETFFQNSTGQEQRAFLMEMLEKLSAEKLVRKNEALKTDDPLTLERKKKDK